MSATDVASELRSDAPEYVPTFLRCKQSENVTAFESPVVFLMFGCRGAGKSTQSTLLSKTYNLLYLSSGDIYKSGKQPFVELRKILNEHFGDGKERVYNGVVLDRFIANTEFEAFYVQSALRSVGLPVPFVFMLAIDQGLAAKRAEERGDNKGGNQRWRAVEQKAQAITANTVYAPIQCLKTIRVESDMTIDDVFNEIKTTIANQLPPDLFNLQLPREARREVEGTVLVEDYELYMELANDVHTVVGNLRGRRDSAPLSNVGAHLDKEYFSFANKRLRSQLTTMHVTLKADGLRFLVMKHKTRGYIGFPSAFTHCYELNDLFEGVEMAPKPYTELKKWMNDKSCELPADFLLDTEVVVHEKKPTLYIIDFIYFWGLDGRRMQFEQRLKVLREYFGDMKPQGQVIAMKDYVPINKIRTLVEEMKRRTELPVDGLIFQHNGSYRFGSDKFLIKWKPVHLCTVDFRLANGRVENGVWTFDLFVTDDFIEENGFREVAYPGATALIPASVVEENGLQNGMIIEMALSEKESVKKTSPNAPSEKTRWTFRNARNDKPSPNKYSIVTRICELMHVDLDELVSLCEKVPFYRNV
ncbi:RNA guanylyltransferase [Trypanosoma brucei gambiense DAL972]|uniref:RNA guanylyltransferase n=1 Tax=Trypanosoma brucei gambiense (strain MHOM/CI/86/DAL972) TaxID=679716 RepID=D0AA12_TRYB9|nr:RNA guanylyltransferase [Trypanosoma brucei gambiense DAL972]CBH18513.1 RNA guanylyltransferase [Trypanosoma brucei gambiense DAL972]|eukprot:XP_011780777.1 RNA guanylyltransferase [Trypanosoma brucei gambiense DAL972]